MNCYFTFHQPLFPVNLFTSLSLCSQHVKQQLLSTPQIHLCILQVVEEEERRRKDVSVPGAEPPAGGGAGGLLRPAGHPGIHSDRAGRQGARRRGGTGENQADQAEKRLSIRQAADFQAALGAGGGAELHLHPAGGGGRGAEEEGGEHAKVFFYHCICWETVLILTGMRVPTEKRGVLQGGERKGACVVSVTPVFRPPREAKMELEQRKRALRRQQEALQRKTEKLEELYWLTKELNRQLDEQSLNAAIRRSLVENDTELQLQWAQKKTGQAERLLEDQLQLLQKQLEEEARVHEESEKFLRNRQEVLQQQLQQWQQHTKQMLHEKEEQLNKVCRSRIVNLDKVTEMKRKFAEMEEVVKEEMKEQEKRDQQQARVTAATKLQAWWRGCMVRLGLGGGGDKAKEDKKSKKKKADKKKKKKK